MSELSILLFLLIGYFMGHTMAWEWWFDSILLLKDNNQWALVNWRRHPVGSNPTWSTIFG